MRTKVSILEWLYLGLTVCSSIVAALFHSNGAVPSASQSAVLALFLIVLAVSVVSAYFEVRSFEPKNYFIALAVHCICALVLAPLVAGELGIAITLFGVLTVGICIHNPFPLNGVFSVVINGAVLVLMGFVLTSRGIPPDLIVGLELQCGLSCAVIAVIAMPMVFYREKLINCQKENDRLDGLVDRLTRANLHYQEYANTVGEASIENERKRITRDIHDIVGYTLTNNITMMEAIIDMMSINPLGVAHLVRSARNNAEEGLSQVREALHLLRGQEVGYPTGRGAVERLVWVFQQATGVHVEFAYTDVEWDFSQELDSTLYHLVQESLVNSFRHGKATLIRIFMTRRSGSLEVKVGDNGVGSSHFAEGIGLAGMRERIERIGGTLVAGPAISGFELTATVPMEQQ